MGLFLQPSGIVEPVSECSRARHPSPSKKYMEVSQSGVPGMGGEDPVGTSDDDVEILTDELIAAAAILSPQEYERA